MNTIANPLMSHQLQRPGQNGSNSKSLIGPATMHQQQQSIYQAAANDLARRHYAQTISRATNLSQHLQLLSRYHQQQQQQQPQLYLQPGGNFVADSPLSPAALSQQQKYATFHHKPPLESLMSAIDQQARFTNKPLCRCRVMYLGSSVPHITKNGLHGIQEPLRHLYPDEQFNGASATKPPPPSAAASATTTIDISHLSADLGIDSWLSVWSNGLLLENVDEFGREIKRFFSIESLHYCAAVRFFDASCLTSNNSQQQQPAGEPVSQIKEEHQASDQNNNTDAGRQTAATSGAETDYDAAASQLDEQQQPAAKKRVIRFLPLDAPLFQYPGMIDAKHPPMFSAIMRRTSGIKVLECHAFICRRDAAANALVRCCTHAYADLLSASRMSSSGQPLEATLCSRSAATRSLYRPAATTTKHLSLARRGRHSIEDNEKSERRHREQQLVDNDGVVCVADGNFHDVTGLANRSQVKHANNSRNSSSETGSSSLCGAGDAGTNSSGDDNYAIISRHQSRANSRGPTSSDSAKRSETLADPPSSLERKSITATAPARLTRRQNRRLQQQASGSSKSLFSNFRPAPLMAPDHNRREQQTRLMSHSMDLLRLEDNSEREPISRACCQEVAFDAASSSTKRHSKSMQNLAECSLRCRRSDRLHGSFSSSRAGSMMSAGSSSSRAHLSSSCADTNNRRRHRHQKRSLQDISSGGAGCLLQPEPNQGQMPDPMRGERARVSDPEASSHGDDKQQAIYDKPAPPPASAAQTNYYERIEARKGSSAARKRDRSRSRTRPLLAANGCGAAGPSGSATATVSSAATAASRQHTNTRPTRASLQLEANMIQQQQQQHLAHSAQPGMQLYVAPSLAHQFSAHPLHPHHMGPPMPVPVPMPMSMPLPLPLAFAGYPAMPAEAYYPGGTLLKYPPLSSPVPPMHFHDFHLAGQHPNQQRHLANSLAHYYTNRPMAAPASSASVAGALATLSGGHRKRKQQQLAKSNGGGGGLATRFRCLSPPLNFISNCAPPAAAPAPSDARNAIPGRPSSSSALVGAIRESPQACDPERRKQQQQQQLLTTRTKSHESGIDELNVVSGQPGFISHSTASNGTNNNNTAPSSNGKRLSWLKRLSLTMSGANSHSSSPAAPDGGQDFRQTEQEPAANMAERQQQQQQSSKKKRSSRLFVGSLTLGRTAAAQRNDKQQAALVTSSSS